MDIAISNTHRKERAFTIIFGALAVFFTGFPHIWSIYQPYVARMTGWTQGQASLCFYLALLVFVFGNIVGGKMLGHFPPRRIIFIGGGISTAGILLSAAMLFPSPIPMYATYGVMQGLGQGMTYAAVVATVLKWFPNRSGYASAVVVTANGLCGFILTPLSTALLKRTGVRGAFLAIGGLAAISWALASLFVVNAPEQRKTDASGIPLGRRRPGGYTSGEMVRTRKFYLLLATLLCGLMPYFLLSPIAQAVQASRGVLPSVAANAVMAGSLANAGTRLILPLLSDRVGRTACVKGVLTVSILSMAALVYPHPYLATGAVIAVYGCYGGIMGSFPSLTSSIFGLEHVGENYGYVLLGMVAAAAGAPAISNYVLSGGGSQEIVFLVGAGFAAAALVTLAFLRTAAE